MDTRQLAAFCEVVERRSFSEAASRLGVTQPAVSQQVRALEQRLGTQLLDRSGRRVEPTEAGLRLYRGAQRMLALEEQLLDELAEPDAPLHGTLELGASTGPAAIVLPGCASSCPCPTRSRWSSWSPTGGWSSGSSAPPAVTAPWPSSRSSGTR